MSVASAPASDGSVESADAAGARSSSTARRESSDRASRSAKEAWDGRSVSNGRLVASKDRRTEEISIGGGARQARCQDRCAAPTHCPQATSAKVSRARAARRCEQPSRPGTLRPTGLGTKSACACDGALVRCGIACRARPTRCLIVKSVGGGESRTAVSSTVAASRGPPRPGGGTAASPSRRKPVRPNLPRPPSIKGGERGSSRSDRLTDST